MLCHKKVVEQDIGPQLEMVKAMLTHSSLSRYLIFYPDSFLLLEN